MCVFLRFPSLLLLLYLPLFYRPTTERRAREEREKRDTTISPFFKKKRKNLAQSKIFHYLCIRNRSTSGIMSFGWGGCRHNKASLRACAWLSGISQILTTSNTLQHFDVLGICISISIRTTRVCMCAYISAWASVLLVLMLRQCESLR